MKACNPSILAVERSETAPDIAKKLKKTQAGNSITLSFRALWWSREKKSLRVISYSLPSL